MISKGTHVKFVRFMLLSVSEEAKTDYFNFLFRSMYNKTIIRFGFCKGYQLKPKADTSWTSIISEYHKSLIP